MGKKDKQKKKKTSDKNQDDNDDGNIQDDRFKIAQTHPQFQKRKEKKTKQDTSGTLLSSDFGVDPEDIDDRFKAVLTDSRFALGGESIGVLSSSIASGVDKYGRKITKKESKARKLQPDIDDESVTKSLNDESQESDSQENKKEVEESDDIDVKEDSNDDDDDDDDDSIPDNPESRIAYLTALSRGQLDLTSSSDDEDESSESSDDNNESNISDEETDSDDEIYGRAGVLDPSTKYQDDEIEITHENSKFMAVCNMDWTSVRAVDLLAIVSSFSPPGSVKYVKVFPSNFGLERMERDRNLGPVGIWKKSKVVKDDTHDSEGDEHSDTQNNGGRSKDTSSQSSTESVGKEEEEDDDYDNDEEDEDDDIDDKYRHFIENDDNIESDFDPEKLRAYEVSKLKYYFAVVEFTTYEAADVAYKELDGMEVGHSSANMDLRSIPPTEVQNVTQGRSLRDEASMIPSNYSPPDFVVAALQQSAVRCTWEEGDIEREKKLTQYGVGNDAWNAMVAGDDLRAYLASDNSSDEEESESETEKVNRDKKKGNMRKMLGLDNGDDSEEDKNKSSFHTDDNTDDDSFFNNDESNESDVSQDEDTNENVKQISFIPGKQSLENKIRAKLKEKTNEDDAPELTPWEKYQMKRKEKKKDRKRVAKELKEKMRQEVPNRNTRTPKAQIDSDSGTSDVDNTTSKAPSTKEELALLLTGDEDEDMKNYDMIGLMRMDKNMNKKLRGSRKRKQEDLASSVSGIDFKIDTKDTRFAALLDGSDERFGIDKTDPLYKETPAMREILTEQTKRRKSKKKAKTNNIADVNADVMATDGDGARALSSLVRSLKAKVSKNTTN